MSASNAMIMMMTLLRVSHSLCVDCPVHTEWRTSPVCSQHVKPIFSNNADMRLVFQCWKFTEWKFHMFNGITTKAFNDTKHRRMCACLPWRIQWATNIKDLNWIVANPMRFSSVRADFKLCIHACDVFRVWFDCSKRKHFIAVPAVGWPTSDLCVYSFAYDSSVIIIFDTIKWKRFVCMRNGEKWNEKMNGKEPTQKG